jgi:hypothetical protein
MQHIDTGIECSFLIMDFRPTKALRNYNYPLPNVLCQKLVGQYHVDARRHESGVLPWRARNQRVTNRERQHRVVAAQIELKKQSLTAVHHILVV